MAQNQGDDKTEPSLELPSLKLSGLRRRKKGAKEATSPEVPVEAETEAPAEPVRAEPVQAEAPTTQLEAPVETEPPTEELAAAPAPAPAPARRAKKKRAEFALPQLSGRVAAAVTGGAVGLAGALGTFAAITGCKAVRGVSSCGGAPGFFILVAILALMVLLGAVLLKAFGVGDPASTSFLAVGVVTVVVMLVMLDVVFSAWMFVVIPVLGALAYLLSQWVTTRFEDEPGRRDWA